jgi:CheY-like chemotaxis protein
MTKSRLGDNNKSIKRILIIDDEPDVILVLKQVLEANGFEADSYEDPRLSLKNFRANMFDLLEKKNHIGNSIKNFLLYHKADA